MSNITDGSVTERLELLMDKHGLADILIGLELICAEKADHIRHNWQDSFTARNWDAASTICGAAARKVSV